MSPTAPPGDLQDRLRQLFADQAAQVRPTSRSWNEYARSTSSRGTGRHDRRSLVLVAAAVVLVAGIVAVLTLRPTVRSRGAASAPRVHWSTKYVELTAGAVTIDVGRQRFVGADPALQLHSDPGDPHYQTLEVEWQEHGLPMRLYVYFAADDHEWWISELRTYNGLPDPKADWVTFAGERLRTQLGVPFEGDLDLTATENGITSHLSILGLHLLAFSASCPTPGTCDDGGQRPPESRVATTAVAASSTTQGPPNVPPPPGITTPDLGNFQDADSLVAALTASGPLDNETPAAVAAGRAPGRSICADILAGREPDAGTLIHQAAAGYGNDGGVVLVLQRADGSAEMRLYSTGAADPATGGCRQLLMVPLG